MGCDECICSQCLHWWKHDCPHGECYDDLRAKENPFIKAHNGQIRQLWSNWNNPGEQDHWCRGGSTYPTTECADYVHYEGQKVQTCLKANVSVFQDGSIQCSLVENYGCDKCYAEFEEKERDEEGTCDNQGIPDAIPEG